MKEEREGEVDVRIIYTKYLESRALLVLPISEAYLSRKLKEIGWNLTPNIAQLWYVSVPLPVLVPLFLAFNLSFSFLYLYSSSPSDFHGFIYVCSNSIPCSIFLFSNGLPFSVSCNSLEEMKFLLLHLPPFHPSFSS